MLNKQSELSKVCAESIRLVELQELSENVKAVVDATLNQRTVLLPETIPEIVDFEEVDSDEEISMAIIYCAEHWYPITENID